MSNKTNKIAVRKYFTENGVLAFPSTSIPHSKVSSLVAPEVCLLGPQLCDAYKVNNTKPKPTAA